jgi:thymidylate kinase
MAITFFIGCDKVGKSTLFQAVLKKTNSHICVDRFTACQYVYGHHHGKGDDTPELIELRKIETAMKEAGGFFVHVTAYHEDIIERFKQHNEKDINTRDISKVLEDYEQYLKGTSMEVLRINTSRMTIDEAVDKIIDYGDWIDKHGSR